MLKKDKLKIEDEVWTEERIRKFLDILPPEGLSADFHSLHCAYTNMRIENFEEFLEMFAEAGRDFHATNKNGESVADIIAQHRRGAPYREALQRACKQQ